MISAQQHSLSGLYRLRLLIVVALATLVTVPTSVNEAAAQASTPSTPTGLVAPSVSHDSATLSWDDAGDDTITGYQVRQRSRDGDEYGDSAREFVPVDDDTGSAATVYTDASVSPQTRYAYQVKAPGTHGLSEPSGSIEAETTGVPASPPVEEEQTEQTCPAPAAVEIPVTTVPIVVESTTADYFVLYASHDVDGTTVEYPVRVVLGDEGTTTLSENVAALPSERYRVEKYQVADPADVDGDCTDDITELNNLGAMNPVNPGVTVDPSDGALEIPDREAFEALAYTDANGRSYLKFSIFDKDTSRPRVYFQNSEETPHHDGFLNAINLDRRDGYLGTVIYDPEMIAPTGGRGVYRSRLRAQHVSLIGAERIYTLLAANMPLLDDNLAFWIRNEALQQIQSNLPAYEASRVNLVFDDDVYDDINFIALNPGEGYGLLRSLEPDDRPHSRDVVIYETLPNELPRVAGIISTVPQTPLSHVNLRALQDDIPNAFIAHALEDDAISDLIGSYVHYAVSDTGYSIRAATQAEVDGHYASSRRSEAQTPVRDLSATSVTPLSNIGFDDWDSFGVKAANVAVLRTLGFPQGTVPDGFAVPFYFYDEFMKHNNLYDDIEEMLADPDFQSDYDTKVSKLKKLRKKIKKADTPEWIKTALTAMHASFPEGTSLRYRSSTNNEDLPGFNGAGLYDSKTQHPEETAEDGISKSLKQVYASLWNFRAFIERDFHGIDHMKTAMGVLVHPNYSDERVNGVAVSVDPAYNTEGTHYVNSQLGEDLVTNPEARSVPEEVLLYPDGTYSVVALSNQVPDGRLLMTEDQLAQLRRHLAATHTKFLELYGVEQGERFAMEIEFKITSANVLSIKQARPWIFSGPSPEIDPIPSEDPGVALTASFKSVPATHDGSPFDVRFQFSERLSISRESFKNHAVTVTGGSVTNARMARFRVDRWLVTVSPDSPMADVTVVMPHNRPCTVNGAICTFGGRRLSNRLEYTVEGLVPRVPDRPTGRDLSPGVVALEWNDVPRADSYEVQFQQNGRWIDLPANGAEIELDGAGAVVKGLPAASTFNFRVRGVNSYGASEWSPRLIIRTRVDWEGELTAVQSTEVSSIKSGYSIYGSLGWALSPDEFVHEGTTYTVEFLVYAGESLWLGVDPELPADFSLRVGELTYLGSESKALHTVSGAGGYWWPSVAPDWFGDALYRWG